VVGNHLAVFLPGDTFHTEDLNISSLIYQIRFSLPKFPDFIEAGKVTSANRPPSGVLTPPTPTPTRIGPLRGRDRPAYGPRRPGTERETHGPYVSKAPRRAVIGPPDGPHGSSDYTGNSSLLITMRNGIRGPFRAFVYMGRRRPERLVSSTFGPAAQSLTIIH